MSTATKRKHTHRAKIKVSPDSKVTDFLSKVKKSSSHVADYNPDNSTATVHGSEDGLKSLIDLLGAQGIPSPIDGQDSADDDGLDGSSEEMPA
jgi:hypothetical protein